MKQLLLLLFISSSLMAQPRPEDFGYKHLQTIYKDLPVDILILSKKGDEHKRKPLFLFIQGSLPIPLIILDKAGKPYFVFVFKTDSLLNQYHLAIIGKPGVPVICPDSVLAKDYHYSDPATGLMPAVYQQHNYITYFAERDKEVLKFLRKQDFAAKQKVVIAGHSEGGTVAAKLASISPDVGKLIYASENPFGRIMTEIDQERMGDITGVRTEALFKDWHRIVNKPNDLSQKKGDTNKATYQSSIPPIEYLKKLKIPVLVTYGTKDYAGKYNDYLRLEIIRLHKKNFSFKSYAGLDHNYFNLKPDGSINYDIFNWDKVVLDWQDWLNGKPELRHVQ
jgi:pimeloyl-ACP methyl ester carboxylesterase